MKLLYLSFVLLLAYANLQAAPVITLQTNNGDWRTNSSWNLNRIPQNGDTIVIPAGFTAYVNDNIDMGSALLFIRIQGTLHFNGGGAKLILQENCTIMVFMNGKITSTTSPSQVIKIGTSTKYEGSGGTIVGPVIADRNSGAGFAAAGGVMLPVHFLQFHVKRIESIISLQWKTVQEGLVDHFSVERSLTGDHWEVIVNITAINQSVNQTYQYTDILPWHQSAHYRIKHTDKEGKKVYTAVQSVRGIEDAMHPLIITAKQKVSIYFPERSHTAVQVNIYTADGKTVISKTLDRPEGEVIISLPLKGHYIIQLKDHQQLHISRQIVF
jgi:hypothetical protein